MKFRDDVVLKIFPVIRPDGGDYETSRFFANTEIAEVNDKFNLKADVTLEHPVLWKHLQDGDIKLSCIIDSPYTKYREVFNIPAEEMENWELTIPSSRLNGQVEITFALTTTKEFPMYDPDTQKVYGESYIQFPPYVTIGHTEVHLFKIDKATKIEKNVGSIAKFIKSAKVKEMDFDENSDQILIYLPEKEYLKLESLKGKFMRLKQACYIAPVLSTVIEKIKKDLEMTGEEDAETGYAQFRWYNALKERFKDCGYNSFMDKKFMDTSSTSLAVKALGPVMLDAMDELLELFNKEFDEEEEDG